ncbi:MAG: aldo/keto reductase, partial [Pyrinomonadaceae bacterium]
MKMRFLGAGLKVSALGLGCMGMSEFYGERDDEQSVAVIHQALDRGVNFLHTADMYGPFTNEKLVGRAIQGRRGDEIIATKFGNVRGEDGSFLGINGSSAYVRHACEASLARLGIDVIDLYYQHRVDTTVPIEETVGEMSRLVEQGKVRYLGLSEAGPESIRRAHAVHPIAALQTEYSLWSRDPEAEILPVCRELGIGFVSYSPLGRGFLTGQIKTPDDLGENDRRRIFPRFQQGNFERNMRLVDRIKELAVEKNCQPAQLALAWVLAQGENIVPIPGTKREKYLAENVGALDVELNADDLRRIDEIAQADAVAGLDGAQAAGVSG